MILRGFRLKLSKSFRIGKASEIPPGKVVGFTVDGSKVLVSNIDGEFHAIGSVCTHAGGPLEKGTLEGQVITCPWHGSRFDVTDGEVVSGPATGPEPAYKVTIEGDYLVLEV
ncbi:MAG TPA: non-heme iron oxygenase ferredoxin subunit [Nitrososphaerales archaeon]|nr:non-heme iron oxygenase ferredoxin subunit [Nitrososphaerales archaeon]